MSYKELFKLYNRKKFNEHRVLFAFTFISILITMTVSMVIPQIVIEKEKYMNNKLLDSNGGDLKIEAAYYSSKFEDKLKEYEGEGLKIDRKYISSAFIKAGNNKVVTQLLSGYNNLGKDEIIISSSLAKSLNVSVGDELVLNGITDSDKKCKIKEIEQQPIGVNEQGELIGWVKVKEVAEIYKTDASVIFIRGRDGEKLKNELKQVEDGYVYNSIKDEKAKVEKKINTQMLTLNILNSMGYILSIAVIISTIAMMILNRRKDIAILKLLCIKDKIIKRAMKREIGILIYIPLILACGLSIVLAMVLLRKEGIAFQKLDSINIIALIKGSLFNIIIFNIFADVALKLIQSISPISLIKDDLEWSRKVNKQILLRTVVLLPIAFLLYTVVIGAGQALSSSIMIIMFMLAISIGLIALLSIIVRIPIKKTIILYSLNSIKKYKASFLIIMLNTSLLLWFILIGFSLGNIIKQSVNTNLTKELPYNYMVKSNDSDDLKQQLDQSGLSHKYSFIGYMDGKVLNTNINVKAIRVNEISEEKYGAKFTILKGKDLFQGDKHGVLASNSYCEKYGLDIGDTLEVENSLGKTDYKIKGIYDCVNLNSNWLLKASENEFSAKVFLVKDQEGKVVDTLKNCYIANMNIVGDALLAQMDDFLTIFKYICYLFTISAIIFNINMLCSAYEVEKKDYAIVEALGLGKKFITKYQYIRGGIITVISIIMSLGVYYLIVKFALLLMFGANIDMPLDIYIYIPLLAIAITGVSIFISLISVQKKDYCELLREQV